MDFYQFPIRFLQQVDDAEPRASLKEILGWCCVDVGKSRWAAAEENGSAPYLENLAEEYLAEYEPNLIVVMGHIWQAAIGRVTLSSIKGGCLEDDIDQWIGWQPHAGGTRVRIREDLFWDAVEGELPIEHFRYLCAVFSWIGDYKQRRITREQIIARMAGYSKVQAYELEHGPAEAAHLRRISTMTETLSGRQLFTIARPNRRETYFSHTRRKGSEELMRDVLEIKAKRSNQKHAERMMQIEAQTAKQKQRIEQRKAELQLLRLQETERKLSEGKKNGDLSELSSIEPVDHSYQVALEGAKHKLEAEPAAADHEIIEMLEPLSEKVDKLHESWMQDKSEWKNSETIQLLREKAPTLNNLVAEDWRVLRWHYMEAENTDKVKVTYDRQSFLRKLSPNLARAKADWNAANKPALTSIKPAST